MKKVTTVKVLENYRVRLRFNDGAEGEIDFSSKPRTGVFSFWSNYENFRKARIGDSGKLFWNDQIDFCPDSLWLQVTGQKPEVLLGQNLDWLVHKRNLIQKDALQLHKILRNCNSIRDKQDSFIAQDLVGATFSLWRGVFLAYDKESKLGQPPKHAKEFLEKLITDNAITFKDDKNANEWTANYYVDNAGRILEDESRCGSLASDSNAKWNRNKYDELPDIKARWEYNQKVLKCKIELFRKKQKSFHKKFAN